jgi:hypothetical protein
MDQMVPRTFRQSDLTRALKAVRAAGLDIARVEIDVDGKLIIVAKNGDDAPPQVNDLDSWLAKHAHQTERN